MIKALMTPAMRMNELTVKMTTRVLFLSTSICWIETKVYGFPIVPSLLVTDSANPILRFSMS